MAESLGAGELDRLPDRGQAERFAGVDRDVEVLAADVLEGVEVARRREALLGSRHVEPDHAGVAPADRAFGDLDRAGRLAHRGDEQLHDDRMARGGRPFRADPEALEHRLDRLVEGQPLLGAQLGRHPHLGIHDAIGGQVLGAFGRDPGDRVGPLHDPEGVGEGLEVELEALAIGAAPEPRAQVVDIGRRQGGVAVLGGEIDDGRRAEAAVEVVVEERLGRPLDRLERDHRVSLPRPGARGRPRARPRPGWAPCRR